MKRPVAHPVSGRPARPRPGPPGPSVAPPPPIEETPPSVGTPRADLRGSIYCLIGLAATAFFLRGKTPEDVARFGAIGVLISLSISMAMDMRRGIQNVVRTDLMAILALYFLTLTEFLVRQRQFNSVAGMDSTHTAVISCIIAYGGMVIGRHLVSPKTRHPFQTLFYEQVPGGVLIGLFWACVIIGYLNMFISVNCHFGLMVEYFMQPRFAQPWQRPRLGDWKALIYETSMILYLVPPLGGILLARRRKYHWFQVLLVMVGVLFTFFYGFSSGTRNLFASYMVTFLIGYCFAANRRQTKEVITLCATCAILLVVSTKLMLDFREIGLEDYVKQGYYNLPSNTEEGQDLAVDNNLYAISRMCEYFPTHHAYTNLEIPYLALIHPIPRAIWHSKPEGMSISVEDIFGANGWTVATSVVGEEYMMHGYLAVLLMSIGFGMLCAWWNLLASPKNSEFGILIYASGFFSTVITMRSMNWFSAALLPTLAGLVIGYLFLWWHRVQNTTHATARSLRPVTPPPPRLPRAS